MSNNIRIRTTPNGLNNYVSLKLEQKFDFIEILSLKISQDKAYERFCSDYGAIAGRVIMNSGFGVPNAKVSVFIPISEEDRQDPTIRGLYPYETVSDVNSDGVRYNLLPKEIDAQDDCYTVVGTFSSKREHLDNDEMLYVYQKYYKFTTTTNQSGDFMIFGVPLGSHTVHVDVDISDIGIASQKPYDLIEQGTPEALFYSPTKFKSSKNLNSLVQIKTINVGVNVQPFWGDLDNCIIGINRLDIDLNYNIRPCAIFMGGIFGDSDKNSINKRCRPRKGIGEMCQQVTTSGTIEMLRKNINNQIERFDVNGGRAIDDNGAWAYQIPMNLDYVVTDEFGNLVPSDNPNVGIPTRARVRFRISMDEDGGAGRLRTRGKYIVPHNPKNKNEIDFSFDTSTPDNENTFRDFYWNKIYSVKSFIPRVEKSTFSLKKAFKRRTHIGIKNVDGCIGDKNPMPYNRAYVRGNVLFTIICFLFSIVATLVSVINTVFCALAGICIPLPFFSFCPFGFLKNFTIKLKCPNDDETKYVVGCTDTVDSYLDCVSAVLTEELGLYEMDFYNDWINGTLYYYLLKYKKKIRGNGTTVEKFCDAGCAETDNTCQQMKIIDTTYDNRTSIRRESFTHGLLVKHDDELYYPPILFNRKQLKLFATDTVNLGAVLNCDWQGFPKIVDYLTSTSYKLPPLLAESYLDDDTTTPQDQDVVAGMFDFRPSGGINYKGLFFNASCINGVNYDATKARNIRRQCELNVDLLEYTGTTQVSLIGVNQIYDTTDPSDVLTSLNRYVRDSFYLLNISGSSISTVPMVPYNLLDMHQGTSFGTNINSNVITNGDAYDEFRGWVIPLNGEDISLQTNNSYYMYFGAVPGKTGLDKLKSKFFIQCVREASDDFIIDTTPTNISSNGTSDGSISFTFIGGTYPFTYTWVGVDVSYSFGPVTTTTQPPGGVINNLAAGTYQITATDGLGNTVVKEVTVGQPLGFSCFYSISGTPSTITSNDGSVEIVAITNGVLPYTLSIYNQSGALFRTLTFNNEPNSDIIYGFGVGTFRFVATDSNGQICEKEVVINAPQLLSIINVEKYNNCNGDCRGIYSFDVVGGTPSYNITVFSAQPNTNNFTLITDPRFSDTQQTNLCPGIYRIRVEDSGEPQPQSTQTDIVIERGLTLVSKQRINSPIGIDRIIIRVSGGILYLFFY